MRNFPKTGVYLIAIGLALILISACRSESQHTLRLATTTSTYDSGLLDAILPDFEQTYEASVEVIAVGTGQALALGERGDVDVLLVHDPIKEEAFISAGHGVHRTVLMYNDFIIVGPLGDPAGVRDLPTAAQAFQTIAAREVEFASRGDQSGTHAREMLIWEAVGMPPTHGQDWYLSLGQGMGSTLQFANERGAYTLTDRGTFLAQRENLANLDIIVGGASFSDNPDESLLNCYSVIIVNPQVHPGTEYELARHFHQWITDPAIMDRIGEFGVERFGQPLFYPVEVDGEKLAPG